MDRLKQRKYNMCLFQSTATLHYICACSHFSRCTPLTLFLLVVNYIEQIIYFFLKVGSFFYRFLCNSIQKKYIYTFF
jgi:hypothetical protein